MKYFKYWVFLFFLFCKTIPLAGQIDTIISFPSIEIIAKPIRAILEGERQEKWDSTALAIHNSSNIAEVLSEESSVFMKSYGLGSLATSSIRGGAASHTAVIWNGHPIQSPLSGVLDFSLLPAFFTDELTVSFGGGSASWGSGAIGGTVLLNNIARFNKKPTFLLNFESGSFGWQALQTGFQYGGKNWSISTRYLNIQAENDFEYEVRGLSRKRQQQNAALRNEGILQEAYYKINKQQQIGFQLWVQESQRELPPRTTQLRSEDTQKDNVLRANLSWRLATRKLLLKARSGYIVEKIDYRSPLIQLIALNEFITLNNEIDALWTLSNKQTLFLSAGYTHNEALADGFNETQVQSRANLFGSFRQKVDNWTFQLSLRQIFVNDFDVPLIPTFGFSGKLNNWLTLRGKVARNVRVPTLNDRFWRPGGNPDLELEEGWSQEVGLRYHPKRIKKLKLSYEVTLFSRMIDNWILWSLPEGALFWSGNNIAEVWSRGVEQRLSLTQGLGKGLLRLQGGYDYILSTNQVAIDRPKIEKGEQVYYIPEHQFFFSLGYEHRHWGISYRHSFTGPYNVILEDMLDGYDVANLRMHFRFNVKKLNVRLHFRVHNLWNASYEVIERFPMPGTHFRAGVQLRLKA